MEYPLLKACIDLDAIQKNIHNLKQVIDPESKFMAVVKADAYGHGAVKVARHALKAGADWLGVARLDEAWALRKAGIEVPVLVFGYVHPSQAAMVNDLDLVVTVCDLEMATALSRAARAAGKNLKAHLKVDTGMGRLGMIVDPAHDNGFDPLPSGQMISKIQEMVMLPNLELKGIYTHFAAADEIDRTYTDRQIRVFEDLLAALEKKGVRFEVRHAANSAGILKFPGSHFDMVRAGICLYGLYPSCQGPSPTVTLFPAMRLTSVVTAVRSVPKGFCVSYGMTHKTRIPTRLASIAIGYADGFSRQFSSNCEVLVRGVRARVVGRVCMDQTMIDVGHIPHVETGDEVVLIGSQGDQTIRADELAKRIHTIHYEIVSALTPRVKRIYSGSGSG